MENHLYSSIVASLASDSIICVFYRIFCYILVLSRIIILQLLGTINVADISADIQKNIKDVQRALGMFVTESSIHHAVGTFVFELLQDMLKSCTKIFNLSRRNFSSAKKAFTTLDQSCERLRKNMGKGKLSTLTSNIEALRKIDPFLSTIAIHFVTAKVCICKLIYVSFCYYIYLYVAQDLFWATMENRQIMFNVFSRYFSVAALMMLKLVSVNH